MTMPRRSASMAFLRRGATTMWCRARMPQAAVGRACSNNRGDWAARAARRSSLWKRSGPILRCGPCVRSRVKSMARRRPCRQEPRSIFPALTRTPGHSRNMHGRNRMPTRDEPVYVRVEDEHILGTLISPGALMPGVLFVHGWGGDQRQYVARAHELSALGCVCLTFDLRGHAQTQARHDSVSREDNMRDVLAAYDYLAALRNVDSDAIAVVGSSYGGYLAALLTERRPVKWLSLRVPALYKDSEWTVPKLRLRSEEELPNYSLQAGGSGGGKEAPRVQGIHGRCAHRRVGARRDDSAPGHRQLSRSVQQRQVADLSIDRRRGSRPVH